MPKYKCGHTVAGTTYWREIKADSARAAAERYAEIRDAVAQSHPTISVVLVMDSSGVVGFYEVLCHQEPVYRAFPKTARELASKME